MKRLIIAVSWFLVTIMASTLFAANSNRLTVFVLCDDGVASEKFMAEHGVAIFVDLPNGHHWLIDTGTTDVFMENAKIMGISLDNLTGIAISHGHDDHTGGLTFYPRLKGAPPFTGIPTSGTNSTSGKKANR